MSCLGASVLASRACIHTPHGAPHLRVLPLHFSVSALLTGQPAFPAYYSLIFPLPNSPPSSLPPLPR